MYAGNNILKLVILVLIQYNSTFEEFANTGMILFNKEHENT